MLILEFARSLNALGRKTGWTFSRILAGGMLFGAALLFASIALAADRGLDLTDEGFHLLAAQQADLTSSYLSIPPFHWHTRPLLLLVGNDLAAFRTSGAAILLSFSALVGASAARTGRLLRLEGLESEEGASSSQWLCVLEMVIGGLISFLAAFLFFGGLILRSPSYYWVNVVGALIGLLGILRATEARLSSPTRYSNQGASPLRSNAAFSVEPQGSALVGFGAFFAFPGNPVTSVGIFVVFFATLWALPRNKFPWRNLLQASTWALGLVGIAVGTGFWSASLPQMLLRALRKPGIESISTSQGLLESSADFFTALLFDDRLRLIIALVPVLVIWVHGLVQSKRISIPVRFRSKIQFLPILVLWSLVAVPHLLFATIKVFFEFPSGSVAEVLMPERAVVELVSYQHYAISMYRLIGPALIAAFIAHLSLLAVRSSRLTPLLAGAWVFVSLRGTDVYIQTTLLGAIGSRRTPYPHVGITLVVLMVGVYLIHRIGSIARRQDQRWVRTSRRIASSVIALALIAGTGSANGFLAYLQLTSVIVAAGLIVLGFSSPSPVHRWSSAVALTSTFFILSVVYAADNTVHPYRNPPLVEAAFPLEFGPARSVVYVDSNLAESLTRLAAAAEEAGWQPGTPLLDLASPWVPGVPAHLGARAPQSILPTMGGFRLGGEEEVLRSNIRDLKQQSFADPWVLVTAEGDNRRGGREESLSFVRIANDVIGLDFPTRYRLVHREELQWVHVELWAPVR